MEHKKPQPGGPVTETGKASVPARRVLDLPMGSGKTSAKLVEALSDLTSKSGRLRCARAALKLSGASFGAPIGKAKGTISQWESGAVDYSLSDSLAIELVWGISSAWLMTGIGEMRSDRQPYYLEPRKHSGIYLLPLLDGLPSCGPSGEIADLGPDAERLPFSSSFIEAVLRQCGAGTGSNLFLARVQGDSMSPTIQPGDTVMLNTALPLRLEPRKGMLHMVRRAPGSSEARVKRLFLSNDGGHLTMVSDNPAYPPITVPIDGEPVQDLVVGRVCWYGRTLLDQMAKPEDW